MMQNCSFAAIQSPFQRLRDLLGGTEPGLQPIDMSVGEPRHGFPAFAGEIIREHMKSFGAYPPVQGTDGLREAISVWLEHRFALPEHLVDEHTAVLPLSGTREGLVSAIFIAKDLAPKDRPCVLMPNPFYQAYLAAALSAGCEPVLLPAGRDSGFLPDLDVIPAALLDRAVAFYIASPANPQGAVATVAYLQKLVTLAEQHDFYLFSDECYSEIYRKTPPDSALTAAYALKGDFNHVLAFNSLSKRSNAPGLRSGFIAGDKRFIQRYLQFRNVAGPQIPLPIQKASAALWADETHVEQSRALYRAKFDLAAARLSTPKAPLSVPDGGMFLWLDLAKFGGGEASTLTIWQECGVKILPGAYLAQPDRNGANLAEDYARLALVDPIEVVGEAIERLSRFVL